jgi:hypothetical protein
MENDTLGAHEALMKLYGRCSFWADGEHCFVQGFVGGLSRSFYARCGDGHVVTVKTCRCGAEVSRSAVVGGTTPGTGARTTGRPPGELAGSNPAGPTDGGDE